MDDTNNKFTKENVFKIIYIFFIVIVISSWAVSLVTSLVRFYEVSKIDPDITLYNYKDPIVSHLFIYSITISSIILFPPILTTVCVIIYHIVMGLKIFVDFLINEVTWKHVGCFILALVALGIVIAIVWSIASLALA